MGPIRQLRTPRPTLRAALCAAPLLTLAACAPTQPTTHSPPTETPVELGGVRIYHDARIVEFDGTIPLDTTNPDTPDVFLELVACTPDTREHESLIVSPTKPSFIHGGLLALGLSPGAPGRVEATADGIVRTPATGDAVRVELLWRDASGVVRTATPHEWIRSETGEPVGPFEWVFAGSRFVVRNSREVYDASGTGTVIGLTTFGSEVIAPTTTISPDSGTDAPAFLADNSTIPPINTPVTVRIRPAD